MNTQTVLLASTLRDKIRIAASMPGVHTHMYQTKRKKCGSRNRGCWSLPSSMCVQSLLWCHMALLTSEF